MNHARHLIREAYIAALKAANTAAATRVYDNPADPARTLPALHVVDLGEQQDTPTLPGGASRLVDRMLSLLVQVQVSALADWARARDQLLAQVETAIAAANVPGVKYVVPAGVEFDTSSEGERPVAVARQRFDIFYRTTQGDPASAI